MTTHLLRLTLPLALLTLGACASTPMSKPDAMATLNPASGSQVRGNVSFRNTPEGIHMEIIATGLPAGAHGFHIHEVGDCSAPDASSAKGHFNPYAKSHGNPTIPAAEHHAGDMPNLVANASGEARVVVNLHGLRVGTGDENILGRAVVIHADPDDYKSQPAGNSGKRIACGVIVAP
ncbi:MAG: superoxide dismutase family protein [Betaproteobacteria bacterium]|nr:superoxide dismutase family protein [Betaproteobacteria bacterium]